MSPDEGFVPYLVLVCFDRGTDLRDRIEESLPLLQGALKEIGTVQPAMSSYDVSVVSYFVSNSAAVQPWQVIEQLQSPRLRRVSPLKTHDRVLVISVELGLAHRMERVTDWLTEHGSLFFSEDPLHPCGAICCCKDQHLRIPPAIAANLTLGSCRISRVCSMRILISDG